MFRSYQISMYIQAAIKYRSCLYRNKLIHVICRLRGSHVYSPNSDFQSNSSLWEVGTGNKSAKTTAGHEKKKKYIGRGDVNAAERCPPVWEVLRAICLGNRSKTIYYIDMRHGLYSYLARCCTTGRYCAASATCPATTTLLTRQLPSYLLLFPFYNLTFRNYTDRVSFSFFSGISENFREDSAENVWPRN